MPIKISELPSSTAITGTELVPIVQTGVTKKTTIDSFILANFDATLNYAVGTIGASLHHINVKMFPWLAKGDGTTDDRAACQAAINHAHSLGGGFDVEFPDGDYLINGVASSDTFLNGLVVPFDGFTVDKRIKLVATGNARLKCGSNDMILVRASRVGTQLLGLQLNGNSKTNVWGIGMVPEDRTQTVTLVSQSFCKVDTCHVQGFTEGLVLEPGPTTGGFQSGAFYPVITNSDFNLNARSMWFKPSPHDATNRPTRGNIAFNRIERGNCGIDLEYATEFNLYGNNFQFFKSTYSATPIATACAIHLGPPSEGNNLYGGEAEQCDADINNESTFDNALFIGGFSLGGVNINVGQLSTLQRHLLRLVKSGTVDQQLSVDFLNSQFARLVADYDAVGVKTLDVVTNSVRRFGWFNGITTHYGSVGNTTFDATGQLNIGNGIKFPTVKVANADVHAMDDYAKKQTFTPVIVGTTAAGVGTYDAGERTGRYSKIGDRVFFNIALTWTAHTGTGNMRVGGMPIASDATASNIQALAVFNSNIALTAGYVLQAYILPGTTQIVLQQVPTGGGASLNVPIDTAGSVFISGQYETA